MVFISQKISPQSGAATAKSSSSFVVVLVLERFGPKGCHFGRSDFGKLSASEPVAYQIEDEDDDENEDEKSSR
jgi:hypothetical protein